MIVDFQPSTAQHFELDSIHTARNRDWEGTCQTNGASDPHESVLGGAGSAQAVLDGFGHPVLQCWDNCLASCGCMQQWTRSVGVGWDPPRGAAEKKKTPVVGSKKQWGSWLGCWLNLSPFLERSPLVEETPKKAAQKICLDRHDEPPT